MKRSASLLILGLCLLCNACGWHLRGHTTATSSPLQHINLQATDVYTPLYRSFKREMEQQGITLSTDADAPRIKLIEETLDSRILTLKTQLDPAEDQLTLSIRYQLNDQIHKLSTYREVRRDVNRAAARDNEADMRVEQMRNTLIQQIIQQAGHLQQTSENLSQ